LPSIHLDISPGYLTALRWPTAQSSQHHSKWATSPMPSRLISSLLALECTRRRLDLFSMLPLALGQISHMPSQSRADLQPNSPRSIGKRSSTCSATSAGLVSTNLPSMIHDSSMIPTALCATPMPTSGEKQTLQSGPWV